MAQPYPGDLAAHLVYKDGPSEETIRQLLHVLFFASMEPEEGRYQPIALVYVSRAEALQSIESPWDVTLLRDGQPLEPRRLVKLAGATAFTENLVVVSSSEKGLEMIGFATPRDRTVVWDRGDSLLRLVAPRPGILVGTHGAAEVARYERGAIVVSERVSPFSAGPHRLQLESIRQAALAKFTTEPEKMTLVSYFQEIVSRVARSGHGGLLAILPPDVAPDTACERATWLAAPLPLGALLDRAYAANEDVSYAENARLYAEAEKNGWEAEATFERTQEEGKAEWAEKKADEMLARAITQVVSMMTVDGAVLCSHSLDVLAFGAKLKSGPFQAFEVKVEDGRIVAGTEWTPSGTRHAAAAHFAATYADGIVFVVSQDGQAAVMQQIDGRVVYWPLRTFFFKEFPWSWV